MVLIMLASHLWLAKYLMLINSLILSMNPVRKIDVKSLFSLPRAVSLKHRFAQAVGAYLQQILGSDPNMMRYRKPTFSSQFSPPPNPPEFQNGSPFYSHQSEVLIG